MTNIVIWCADIGSVKTNKFGWCRGVIANGSLEITSDTSIEVMAKKIAEDLSQGRKVALGFECPLFLPISEDPESLTKARIGERDRAWSAGAGCGVLATGLVECVWILGKIKEFSTVVIEPTFNFDDFYNGSCNLFVWEAFVSKNAKGSSHEEDAEIAVKTFWEAYPNIPEANAVTAENPYNLVAAALLRTKISENIQLLSESCVVIKSHYQ